MKLISKKKWRIGINPLNLPYKMTKILMLEKKKINSFVFLLAKSYLCTRKLDY